MARLRDELENSNLDSSGSTADAAARAGWLYYVGRLTQDQIAREMGVSRQRAQRLVARAMAEGLIHVRLNHPISALLDLEQRLRDQFGLKLARVAPSLPGTSNQLASVAPIAAAEIERQLSVTDPRVFALGTGRTLRACIEELRPLDCEHHKIVSLIGNIAPDGSASFYDVIMRIADKIRAPHFPMPIPVIAQTEEDCTNFLELKAVKNVVQLGRNAEVTFVGIGQMHDLPPLLKDGFVTAEELSAMQNYGAVGEIASWAFDSNGHYIEKGFNRRVCGVRVEPNQPGLVVGIVADLSKLSATRAALKGNILNALVIDELTAKALLG